MANFTNVTNDTLVTGTRGNDYIENEGDNVTIDTDAGDDTIYNRVVIELNPSETWYDTLSSLNNVIIDGGEGNDNIYSNGSETTINGDAGNQSTRELVTIQLLVMSLMLLLDAVTEMIMLILKVAMVKI